MPFYYFDVHDHGQDQDDEGKDLPDDNAARVYAVVFAGEFLKHNPELIWDGRQFQVVVTDADKRRLLTINVTATAE
ncbi:DUF6894 family protein [Sphingobium aromaticiconvertens]|uniref:DUF6894 family protein n=1 Tax=Sphingobium aromaticiconvertens TaxID=365341 RepID=UPI003019921C